MVGLQCDAGASGGLSGSKSSSSAYEQRCVDAETRCSKPDCEGLGGWSSLTP